MRFERSNNQELWAHSQAVFDKLLLAEKLDLTPDLLVASQPEHGAYMSLKDNLVIITDNMISMYYLKGQLAAVLGHEIGHYKNKDVGETNLQREVAADYYGINLALKAGFPIEEIKSCAKWLFGERQELFLRSFELVVDKLTIN